MGAFLYKKKITILRSIVANVVAIIICNVIITTISLCVAYGYPLEAILPIRLITNAILLPIYIVATYFFVMLIDKVYTKIKPRYSH